MSGNGEKLEIWEASRKAESLGVKGWERGLTWRCEGGDEDKNLCEKIQQPWVVHQPISAHDPNGRIVDVS